jgi:hypothetical protein
MLLVLIAIVVAFNYPEQEIKRTVVDLPAFDVALNDVGVGGG